MFGATTSFLADDGREKLDTRVLWVVITVICFGSQTAHLKTQVVRQAKAPWLLKIMFSLGAAFVGAALAVYVSLHDENPAEVWGVYTAFVWAPGTVLLLAATSRCGVGLTVGLVCAFASVTSFVTGVAILGNAVPKVGAAIGSITLLLLGVAGLAWTTIRAEQRRRQREGMDARLTAVLVDSLMSLRVGEGRPSLFSNRASLTSNRPSLASNRPSLAAARLVSEGANSQAREVRETSDAEMEQKGIDLGGVLFAVVAGVLYGCQGLFLAHGGKLADGASMMLSQFLLMLLFGGVRWVLFVRGRPTNGHEEGTLTAAALVLALASGGLFGVGFVGQIYVLSDFGDAVGTPLTQANLVIAGLWSIIAFREVQGADLICAFAVSSSLVLAGVCLLAVVN